MKAGSLNYFDLKTMSILRELHSGGESQTINKDAKYTVLCGDMMGTGDGCSGEREGRAKSLVSQVGEEGIVCNFI